MDRCIALMAVALAAPLLMLDGIALATWLQPLVGDHFAGSVVAGCLVLLRIALAAQSAAAPAAGMPVTALVLAAVGAFAVAERIAPAATQLAGGLPWPVSPPLLAVMLAMAFQMAVASALSVAVRQLSPLVRQELALRAFCRRRELGTVAALVDDGLAEHALLGRASRDLDRALARIDRALPKASPPAPTVPQPSRTPTF